MARVKGQKYPTTRRTVRTPVPSTKRKQEEEEEIEEVVVVAPEQPVKRRAGRRPRVAVLEFEKEEEKPAEAVVVVQPTPKRKGAAMSTGGVSAKTPETKNKNEITHPPEAPVKVRVKFPQREREQQKRDREEEEERQASPSLDLPRKRQWVPPLGEPDLQLPPIELVEEEAEQQQPESFPKGLDFTRDAVLIKCCERVGARRGWEYGRIMQAAYDLLLVLWCKKQVGHDREFEFSCPEDIDECWHEFVLNTIQYAQWADKFGGFFPNHTTFTSDDPDEVKMGRIEALMTFGRSRGIRFNSEFWPRISVVVPQAPDLGLFEVYVQTLTGKTFTLKASNTMTVLRLKEKMEIFGGFPTDAQRLIFAGHNMDDRKLLKDYGIGPYSKIHLVLRNVNPNEDFQIFVKTTTGKTIPIRVMSATTVSELKQKIKDKEGIPVDQQRVIHRGTEMNDNNTLDKYNITVDAMVHLVIKLRGC